MTSVPPPAVGPDWFQRAATTIRRNRHRTPKSVKSPVTSSSKGPSMPTSGWEVLAARAQRRDSASKSALQEVPLRYLNACAMNRYHRVDRRERPHEKSLALPPAQGRSVTADELEMCPVWCMRALSRVEDRKTKNPCDDIIPPSLSDMQGYAVREFQAQAEDRGMPTAALHSQSEQYQASGDARSWICRGCRGWQWAHQVRTEGLCAACVVRERKEEFRQLQETMNQ